MSVPHTKRAQIFVNSSLYFDFNFSAGLSRRVDHTSVGAFYVPEHLTTALSSLQVYVGLLCSVGWTQPAIGPKKENGVRQHFKRCMSVEVANEVSAGRS